MPIVPPGCSSEKLETIQDFILKGKAALVSVGIIRDSVLGNGLAVLTYLFLNSYSLSQFAFCPSVSFIHPRIAAVSRT